MDAGEKSITLRLKNESVEKIKHIALINQRSMARQIKYLIEQYIAEYEAKYGAIALRGSARQNVINQSNHNGNNILSVTG